MALGSGIINKSEIKIASWNVNSLARVLKGNYFIDYLKKFSPDILCLNETKLTPWKLKEIESWENYQQSTKDYYLYWNHCKTKKGYSGTAIFTKFLPKQVSNGIG